MKREVIVTGVGSLPPDMCAADAVRLSPKLPFLPQFPGRSKMDEMLYEPFHGYEQYLNIGGRGSVRKGDLEELLRAVKAPNVSFASLTSELNEFVEAAKSISPIAVKFQLPGYYTLSHYLQYAGEPLGCSDEGRELCYLVLQQRAELMLTSLSALNVPCYLLLDEPALPFLRKKELLSGSACFENLRRLVKSLHRPGVQLGIHCCGPLEGALLPGIVEELKLDVVSLPFKEASLASFADWPANFQSRGGKIIWGLVDSRLGFHQNLDEKAEYLARLLTMSQGPADRPLLISADCGYGLCSREQTEAGFAYLTKLGARLRDY